MATLTKQVRDALGRVHQKDEEVIILSCVKRSNFDETRLYRIKFQDGSTANLFSDEVAQ